MCLNVMTFKLRFIFKNISEKYLQQASTRNATSLWGSTVVILHYQEHGNRMPRNRLPRVMKHYSPTGIRNYGRPFKRLLDT